MKIIIAGDGETGTHIANVLSVEGQDVVIMGTDRAHLAELDAINNFITFEGNPVSRTNLLECGVATADLFVAVTPDENANIMACQIAKDCGAGRCVARVDNFEYDSGANAAMLRRNGVDSTIHPEKLAAEDLRRFIENSWAAERFDIHGGALTIVGVRMSDKGSLCGRQLSQASGNPRLFHVVAIKRGNNMIIPRGTDVLQQGDTVYFALAQEHLGILPPLCGRSEAPLRRIMITGAGHVTENLLNTLGGRFHVTVIDPDAERCDYIAARFPEVVVVNAKANDITALKDEGISKCDALLALTGSSETNIVTSMVAREHGVRRTAARIQELQYVDESESRSIDKIINKKILNGGKIMAMLFDGSVSSTRRLTFGQAEIAEIVAREGALITTASLADLKLPRDFTVGGVIRGDRGFFAEGRTQLLPGDHVVVFYSPGALSKVGRYF